MQDLEIYRVGRYEALEARGVVIVIDVIRAFSVAAYALAGGAQALWLVRTVEEAFALRERNPEVLLSGIPPQQGRQEQKILLAGEVGGRLIRGFDLNNSPALMTASDVRGRILVQRTGAGTQGALAVANAAHILPCSLVNARATATYARRLAETTNGLITLHPTGGGPGNRELEEDGICADYVEALLLERAGVREMLEQGITSLRESDRFEEWRQGDSDFPAEDIALVLDVDRFDFAMAGTRKQWRDITYVEVGKVDMPTNS
jgi:2-phosphosulfolactate phosphatase